MFDPVKPLFERLSTDATVTAAIDAWRNEPAIFSGDALPAEYPLYHLPCVLLGPALSGDGLDTFDAPRARREVIAVRLYCVASPSAVLLDVATRAVIRSLHRQSLPAPAGGVASATVSGPSAAPTSGPEVAGRSLTVTVFTTE